LTACADSSDVDRGRPYQRAARAAEPTLPLEQAAKGYKAMDDRRTINTLLRP
jgi:hypothetical protein